MSKPIANTYEEQVGLIDPQKPIRVYRNLATGLWSIKQGIVRCHSNLIFLRDVTFVVSEKQRQRILRERVKNVHAFVQGYLIDRHTYHTAENDSQVTYNPYTTDKFVCRRGKVESADMCCLVKRGDTMKVFASNLVLTEPIGSDTIETVPVHLL